MKRGTLIAAVVLAIGAFACERKHDDTKAGDTTTTSGTVHEEQNPGTGTGTYGYQGSPGVTGDTTGTDRNANVNDTAGSMGPTSGTSLSADQSGSLSAKDGGIAADFDKKDGGHIDMNPKSGTKTGTTGTSKAKAGGEKNTSTSLGDGTSGESTGGQGTYGGKATHGTGPGSDIKK